MILSAVSMFQDMVPIVRHHHERYDGEGLLTGSGGQIEPLARIINVADSFDAMMSDQQYRAHLSLDQTRQQLIEGAGTQFDADIVRTFLELLDHDQDLLAHLTHL